MPPSEGTGLAALHLLGNLGSLSSLRQHAPFELLSDIECNIDSLLLVLVLELVEVCRLDQTQVLRRRLVAHLIRQREVRWQVQILVSVRA